MSQHFVEAGFRIQFQRRVATALTYLRHTHSYRVGEGDRNDNAIYNVIQDLSLRKYSQLNLSRNVKIENGTI